MDEKVPAIEPPRTTSHLALLRQESSPQESEDWVVTYMDLITLLLTMFIVLLAYADKSADSNEGSGFAAISSAIAQAAKHEPQAPEGQQPPPVAVAPEVAAEQQSTALNAMDNALQQVFAKSGFTDEVEIRQTPGKLYVQLKDSILFGSGEAGLRDNALDTLGAIGDILHDSELHITIEGHTDNIPINTPQFPSNWELSSARATTVVRFLLDDGIAPSRVRAIGYADSRPLASNESEAGRSQNRRVIIVLSESVES